MWFGHLVGPIMGVFALLGGDFAFSFRMKKRWMKKRCQESFLVLRKVSACVIRASGRFAGRQFERELRTIHALHLTWTAPLRSET